VLRSYSDESKRGPSPLLSVAGWITTERQSKVLDQRWGTVLGNLPYFHMKEGHHRKYPEVYTALLDCISPEHMIAGFHVAVNEDKYNLATDKMLQGQTLRYWFGGAYTFCMSAYMALVGEWVAQNLPEQDSIEYLFDAGHARSREANMFFEMIQSNERFQFKRRHYRLASFKFVDGKTDEGQILQTADILAWHFNYLLANGQMLAEGKKITRAVKCFYRSYLDLEDIAPSILDTLDMEKKLVEEKTSKRRLRTGQTSL
jgi:hypothetical protein